MDIEVAHISINVCYPLSEILCDNVVIFINCYVDCYYWESVWEASNRITIAEPLTECLLNEHDEFHIWFRVIWECNVSEQVLQTNLIIDGDVSEWRFSLSPTWLIEQTY